MTIEELQAEGEEQQDPDDNDDNYNDNSEESKKEKGRGEGELVASSRDDYAEDELPFLHPIMHSTVLACIDTDTDDTPLSLG